ncbi:unnamed protein product [Porites evermanni]|uniref:TNF receptor-associated factor 6 n=1 Tax=Porites evermanni TaxID=104178 RepID=A0ABN8QZD8_9CNID|nr:unnamed protein product [Porites evermanni]
MAEAPHHPRLPSGYDEEFVSEVDDDLQCVICQLPLKEPVLTRCGHRFCKGCLEEHLKRQEIQAHPYTCPSDREVLNREQDIFPDKPTERKILSYAIKCPSEGCHWKGELRNKETHLETCRFEIVTCVNENCRETMKKKDLNKHVTNTCEWRIRECEYCKEQHPKCHLEDHLETCNKFPLTCPNSCGDLIPREMVSNHIDNDCPLSVVSCPYVEIGCIEKSLRKDVESHLQSATREHLDFACVNVNSTQVQLDEQRRRVQLGETQAQLRVTQKTTRKLEEKLEALQRLIERNANTDRVMVEGGNKQYI